MSYTATVIEVFLSSPANVGPERSFVLNYATEWNRLRSRDTACFMSILSWEEMVAPALGDRAQQVVNEQIGSAYDVYLGLMWTRLGTPTGLAGSGTVEEYDRALDRAKQGDHLRIAALFKTASIEPEAIDPSQLQKVREFKRRIAEEGAFYREFSDEASLRSILSLLFEQIARERQGEAAQARSKGSDSGSGSSHPSTEPDEVGLLEIGDEFTRQVSALMSILKGVADEETRNNIEISACNDETAALIGLGLSNQDAVRPVVHWAASSLRNLADYYESTIDEITDIFGKMSSLTEQDLRIRLEFEDPIAVGGKNIETMKELAHTMGLATSQLTELISVTSSIPRLSSDLAKAKARLGRAREMLRDVFVSFKQSLENSISFFEETVRIS